MCSGTDISMVRKFWPTTTVIVPGVRSPGEFSDDQKRVVSPKEAITLGANYVVVGRQIRDAKDPEAALDAIAKEIEGI